VATTLVEVDATIVARTKARALTCRDLRPLANTSSTSSSHRDTGLWLKDYQLACQVGGVDSDNFIIRNLSLFLADSARMWLEHLPPNRIQSWADLKEIFMGNF